eukprot:scaffold36048_cov18-Tisochrysis_lutea.AAC.1
MCAWGQTDRHGVLISNYVEDGAKVDFASSGKHLLGFGEPFRATSTHAADYNPEVSSALSFAPTPKVMLEGTAMHDSLQQSSRA